MRENGRPGQSLPLATMAGESKFYGKVNMKNEAKKKTMKEKIKGKMKEKKKETYTMSVVPRFVTSLDAEKASFKNKMIANRPTVKATYGVLHSRLG